MALLSRIQNSDRVQKIMGFSFTPTANGTTTIMMKMPGSMTYTSGPTFTQNLTNDRLLYGCDIFGCDIAFGDWISFDVVDHDNVLGAGVDYVLKSYNETTSSFTIYPTDAAVKIGGRYLVKDAVTTIETDMPSNIYGGMWIRLKYTSVGTVDPKIFINLDWEKKEQLL